MDTLARCFKCSPDSIQYKNKLHIYLIHRVGAQRFIARCKTGNWIAQISYCDDRGDVFPEFNGGTDTYYYVDIKFGESILWNKPPSICTHQGLDIVSCKFTEPVLEDGMTIGSIESWGDQVRKGGAECNIQYYHVRQ